MRSLRWLCSDRQSKYLSVVNLRLARLTADVPSHRLCLRGDLLPHNVRKPFEQRMIHEGLLTLQKGEHPVTAVVGRIAQADVRHVCQRQGRGGLDGAAKLAHSFTSTCLAHRCSASPNLRFRRSPTAMRASNPQMQSGPSTLVPTKFSQRWRRNGWSTFCR